MKKNVDLPPEFKLESYPRRLQEATFDRLDLVMTFRPGKDKIGATVRAFVDAIAAHDEIVKVIEEKINEIDNLRNHYRKKNRLFRNLDSAWNVMLDNVSEFQEYQALLPKMRNVEERLKLIRDVEIKAELEAKYERFKLLEPKCSKQMVIYQTFSDARDVKDDAMRMYVKAEQELTELKAKEKQLASLISDDHILADSSNQSLSSLFPNIHVGFILKSINGEDVEDKPYDEVIYKVMRAKSPHEAAFLRYDYRFNPFKNQWNSLQELRDMGVCVEDPMLARSNFVNLAAKGKVEAVRELLMQGEDPDSADLSGNTALVMASANQHGEVVEMLIEAEANVNCRDKNMMTPLLFCVSRGYMGMVRMLLDFGANKTYCDKNGRGVLYYAVLSGNEHIVKLFIKPERANEADSLWGFTPLHTAANQGNLSLVKYLISYGCSIYARDKKKRTAEQIAMDARHKDVAEVLRAQRQGAPGQIIMTVEKTNCSFWLGDFSAMDVRWCADADISSVIVFLRDADSLPRHAGWLTREGGVSLKIFELDVEDHDRSGDSWEEFSALIPTLYPYLVEVSQQEDSNVLICDETGLSTAPAALLLLTTMKYMTRIKDSLETIREGRPNCSVSVSLMRGLEKLQKQLDDKALDRVRQRTRTSVALSTAF